MNGASAPARAHEAIRAVADDRVLLESDRADASVIGDELHAVCALVAEAKGWTHEKCAEITTANARAFLSFAPG